MAQKVLTVRAAFERVFPVWAIPPMDIHSAESTITQIFQKLEDWNNKVWPDQPTSFEKRGGSRGCEGIYFLLLKSWFNHAQLATCPQATLFAPIRGTFWRVQPFSNATYGLLSVLIFELKPVHKPSRQLTRLVPVTFCSFFPLNTSDEKENTESSTLSSLVCVTSHNVLFRPSPFPHRPWIWLCPCLEVSL